MRGRRPGVYPIWTGKNGAEAQVKDFPGALFKGFADPQEAARWLKSLNIPASRIPEEVSRLLSGEQGAGHIDERLDQALSTGKAALFTDGACRHNPGPGGYGALLISENRTQEISGGFRRTTNNRMELMACILGLKLLKRPSQVVIFSDSRYVVNMMKMGAASRWKAAGWRKVNGQPVLNVDLWDELLKLCAVHQVEFIWVKGHAEYEQNMRCDELAVKAATEKATGVDAGFERK